MLLAEAVLGLIAGIAGGIYLVPLILLLGLGTIRAVFVLLNSLIDVVSRMQHQLIDLTKYVSFIVAVMSGELLGSSLGSSRFYPKVMEKILSSIVLIAFCFLSYKIFFLIKEINILANHISKGIYAKA